MDLPLEEFQNLSSTALVVEAVSIPRSSPRTFSLITLTLVFPLSFAILAHTLFTHPILVRLDRYDSASSSGSGEAREWLLLFLYQFLYLLFLFTFSLLSTAAVVFNVASLYASKPVSFTSTLSAIPPVFSRLFHTFLWVSAIMTIYNLVFAITLLTLYLLLGTTVFIMLVPFVAIAFLGAHVYISAIWHLASVITVLEPVCGLPAMRKSRDLLKGKTKMAACFVLAYLCTCGIISAIFRMVVVRGGEDGGPEVGTGTKVVVGGVLVAVLVVVNLVGLLLQSVFYYVCKSFHHQAVDKSALYNHLGGYLGEYVPLKSDVQMESI